MDKRVKIALGTAAVGAGIGIAYYMYKNRSKAPATVVDIEIEIEEIHATWLKEIAAKYTNGDTTKALHKLIDYCQVSSAQAATEEEIFKKVRCNTCGKKEKITFVASLTPEHIAFVDSSMEKYEISGGQSKTLRVMFEYVMNDAEEATVFGD